MTEKRNNMKRECGVLLPISALPSRYGIGAFSKEAYKFVDQLQAARQQYWQILPLGPTGYGDSPYQSFSAFAGNPYYIDLEQLIEDQLLKREECDRTDFGNNPQDIDYEKLYFNRFPLLQKAFDRWKEVCRRKGMTDKEIEAFLRKPLTEETQEYCFYMAVKDSFDGAGWDTWDADIRLRKKDSVAWYQEKLADQVGFYLFQQYLFQEQWSRLKKYANDHGVRIIGDIPIYVAFDGADSWSHPELFQFDKEGKPVSVAGCPPDGFSPTGQLWGNPLYRWDYHRKTKFAWWIQRMKYSFELYDVVRVDHFRGFDEYYAIPAEDTTAEHGCWEKGPGYELFETMEKELGKLDIIAEDLGFLTPSVLELVEKTGFPGMKVLEFAFDASGNSTYLPHKYQENCVVYTGTHDNTTLQAWYKSLDEGARRFALDYMGNERTPLDEIHWDYIRLALASVARMAIIPLQDYLGLDVWARINEPSTLGKNWRWRMRENDFTQELIWRCAHYTWVYGRQGTQEE